MDWMMEHVTFVLHRRKNQIIRFAKFKINHMSASTGLFLCPSITFRWTGGYFGLWICWEWLRRWFKTKSIEWGPFSVDYYSLVRVLVYLSWIKRPNLMVNIWPKILKIFCHATRWPKKSASLLILGLVYLRPVFLRVAWQKSFRDRFKCLPMCLIWFIFIHWRYHSSGYSGHWQSSTLHW